METSAPLVLVVARAVNPFGVDGSALKVTVDKSSRHRELDQAAMQAVKSWKFNPEIRNGRAVEGWVLVPISFRLNEG